MTKRPNNLKYWILAARPFSFTASIMPVILGAALVPYYDLPARWPLFPLIIIASLAMHSGTNMVSEYFDLRKGVDRPETYGSSRVLVEGHLLPYKVFLVGMALFALSAAIGLVFIYILGWPILLLGFIGLCGGFFYTGYPIAFKYLGLGDLGVFILMGPLMVIGSFYVLTGTFRYEVLLVSLGIGFLVTAILTANNLRDIMHDTQAGIRSTATVLGHKLARIEYIMLVVGGYIAVLPLVLTNILPAWSLIVLLTIPLAIKNIKLAMTSEVNHPEKIASLDIQTAQLHLPFSILLVISILLGAFL